MPRHTRGPSHDPTRGRRPPDQPESGRTPPARPDEAAPGGEAGIAREASERLPDPGAPSNGTSFESPEAIDPAGRGA